MITLNNVIKSFETFCSDHNQINTFFSGKTWNFQTERNIYPAVIVIPVASSIEQGAITYNFNIFIADKLNKDRSNLNEILSDTALIASDFVSFFDDNYDDLGFMTSEGSVSIDPFEESFDDVVAGWMLNFSVQVRYSKNECIIPKD